MTPDDLHRIFTPETLNILLPPETSDRFFDALFGDPEEGAYDIALVFQGSTQDGGQLKFELELRQRPGRCLACNLTHGLPEVFARHPVLNIAGLVQNIEKMLPQGRRCRDWRLGSTRQHSKALHTVPLTVNLG